MSNKDNMGNRLKAYENCYRFYLPRRLPVIVRLDMRAGHSFTKGFARPYDKVFASTMWETAKKLCENISGVRFAYTQSDEISLVFIDYENINTEPWFGNNLQKIVSISASMATLYFNKAFEALVAPEFDYIEQNRELRKIQIAHLEALDRRMATFDSRAFALPREEVYSCLLWRQLDCKRNSIQLLGQANFSHSQLQYKNSDEIQEMLWQEKGINWVNEPQWFKNGVAIYKKPTIVTSTLPDGKVVETERNKWYVDMETPVFTTDKNYIEKHITFNY